MRLFYEKHGEGNPLILLHAFPLTRQMWRKNIEPIQKAGFQLILPDLRGFGESENVSEISRMEEMAADVFELLNSLGIQKTIVGGLSMGGYAALNFYRLFPQAVAGLILCDTNSAPDSEEKRAARYTLIEEIEKRGARVLVEKMLPDLIGDYTKQNDPSLITELERKFLEANAASVIAALRGMAERESMDFLLEKISVPTALIFGEDDKIISPKIGEAMSERIPEARIFKIKNAGHLSNLEQPEVFNRILIDFIKHIEF